MAMIVQNAVFGIVLRTISGESIPVKAFAPTIQNEYSGVDDMQSNVVKAFRQRLIRAGFTSVSIDCYGVFYFVSCVSPDGDCISKHMDEREMISSPRRTYIL